MRFAALAALGLALALPAAAQRSVWTAHTSMRSARALAADGDSALWVATTGGVFRLRLADRAVRRVTVADSLSGTDGRAVGVDARRRAVWIGYGDGTIDVLSPETAAVETLADIARAERFGTRDVRRLVPLGDSMLVATAFGAVVYDPAGRRVRFTVTQFGALPAGRGAFDAVRLPSRRLAVALDGGVALAPLDGRNLQDPAAWAVEAAGLPSATVRSLALFEGRLYAGTDNGLAVRAAEGGTWTTLLAGEPVVDLVAAPDRLLGLTPSGLVAVSPGGAVGRLGTSGLNAARDLERAGSSFWAASETQGLVPLALSATAATGGAPIVPPGPDETVLNDLRFADDGTLWAAGAGDGPAGYHRRSADGTAWRSFTPRSAPPTPGSAIAVAPTNDGGAWGGTSGTGVVRLDASGGVTVYGRTNSSLTNSEPSDPAYLIADGLDTEADGTLWVTNKFALTPLHVRTKDGRWAAVPIRPAGTYAAFQNGFNRLFVDSFGQKWITLQDVRNNRNGAGLLVLGTGADPVSSADDTYRYFDKVDSRGGLPSLLVNAVDEDRRGRIWVGTENGVAFLVNTSVTSRDPSAAFQWPVLPAVNGRLDFTFNNNISVADIAVDPAGNVWAATAFGAYRIDEVAGGNFVVARHFTAANSPLPSDRVLAVAVQPETGEVFFATSGGLVSWRGGPLGPARGAQPLVAAPNPWRASTPGGAPGVTIRGLVADTEVRILSADGRLVRRLDGRGGSVEWDGRDDRGEAVPSGVYLVVAVGTRGEGAAYGKVAVIR